MRVQYSPLGGGEGEESCCPALENREGDRLPVTAIHASPGVKNYREAIFLFPRP